jgi:hypothetical protein
MFDRISVCLRAPSDGAPRRKGHQVQQLGRAVLAGKSRARIIRPPLEIQTRTSFLLHSSVASEQPRCAQSWAPCGQTPVPEFNFNWQRRSVIAGLTMRSYYYRMHPGAIRTTQVIAFIGQLRRQIRGRMELIGTARTSIAAAGFGAISSAPRAALPPRFFLSKPRNSTPTRLT